MPFKPPFNTGPITFWCERILDYIESQQDDAITWMNTNWGSAVDYTLLRIDRKSMHVGTPQTAREVHARNLYAIPVAVTDEQDNADPERHTIILSCQIGNVAFTGTGDSAHAQQAAGIEVVGFYNWMLRAILKQLRDAPNIDYLTATWPVAQPPQPPSLRLIYREDRVSAATVGASQELGSQSVITIELQVYAEPFLN